MEGYLISGYRSKLHDIQLANPIKRRFSDTLA